jgi:DNA-binding transcriptional ArsR family regulator
MSPISTFPPCMLIAAIAHALAHPIRVEILEILRTGEKTVSEITEHLKRPQANISQHLAVLREVNLVGATREGMSVSYTLRTKQVDELLALLNNLSKEIDTEEFTPRGRGGRHTGRGRGRGRGRHTKDDQ